MAYLDTIDEKVIYRASLHWIIFVRPIINTIIGCILIVVQFENVVVDKGLLVLGYTFLLFGIVDLIKSIVEKISTEIAITESSVISKTGFIRRDTVELKLTKVESARVMQSVLGRILNYGSVAVIGTGNSYAPIPYISDPLGFRSALNEVL